MKTRILLIGVSVVIGILGVSAGLRLAARVGEHIAQPTTAVLPQSAPDTADNSGMKMPATPPKADAVTHARAQQALLNLPLPFIANAGQTDPGVDFTVHSLGGALFFTPDEVVFSLPNGEDERGREVNPVVRLRLVGANPKPALVGREPLAGVANYFLGNDPARWRSNVPTYGAVAYRAVYPGIDLGYRGTEGHLKSEFIVSPGADPSLIQMAYSGVTDIRIRDDGALVLQTVGGELIDEAPVAYQEIDGKRILVLAHFRLSTSDRQPPTIGFTLGDYNPEYPLVIDPVLVFSTYLGGSSDAANAIAVDTAGNIYIRGATSSIDFPTRDAIFNTFNGGLNDIFVTQIISTGSVYTYGFSTYLGGSGFDGGDGGIAVDGAGNIYVTGVTTSTDFPLRNPISATLSGAYDAFVTQIISASGVYTLGYSTYLGGSGGEDVYGIAVDVAGNAYVVGLTDSTNFPTWHAVSTALSGPTDAFITKIISMSNVITYGYSTYLGGSGYEFGLGIAVDGAGNVFVTGETTSADFPTRNAISNTLSGPRDAYVTQIISTSGVYTYGFSTYLGGSSDDFGYGIALDGMRNVYIAGGTSSNNFPTRNAIQSVFGGGCCDVIVTQIISASGTYTYGYSTYLGGSGNDQSYAIAVDNAGNAYVTGVTTSTDFPAWNAISNTFGGPPNDAFVTQIISTGRVITYGYSTYLGGSGNDRGYGVAVDSTGNAFVTGYTQSGNFPITQNAISNTLLGTSDAFVTVIAPIAADLSISKSDGVTSTAPDAPITYTIVVTNSGPDAVSGAVVTDTFPAAVTGVLWSCAASGGASCGTPGGSGDISMTVNLSATGAITITASGTVVSNAIGTLGNTAYVSHPADLNTANNSATDTDMIAQKVYLPLIMR